MARRHTTGSIDGVSRRRLLRGLAATGAAGSVAGCMGGGNGSGGNGSGGGSGGNGTGTTRSEPAHVSLSGWAANNAESKLLRQLIGTFEERTKAVAVDYSPVQGKYKQKIKTQLGAGNAPDVFYVKAMWAPQFASAGVLKDLKPFVEREADYGLDAFFDPLVDAFRYQGGLYGIPKDFSTLGYFYNRTMYETAGLGKEAPATWSEWESHLRALERKADVDYPMIAMGTPRVFWPMLYQNGGQVLTDDGSKCVVGSDAAVEALRTIVRWKEDGLVGLPSQLNSSWHGAALGNEEVAVAVLGPWGLPFLESKFPAVDDAVDVAHNPIPKGGRKATIAYTVSYSQSVDAKPMDASWKLTSYLTGHHGMKLWASKGIALTARKTLSDIDYYEKHPRYKTLLEAGEWSHVWNFGPHGSQIANTIKPQLQGAMVGEISPKQALQTAQEEVNSQVLS